MALIVATGSTVDYRRPDYFGLLENRVNSLDLSANFLILGSVPRSHFLALMSSASAYLNPSYSEGWNTSVEEAKLFSLPLLLSDIPVHREQSDSNTLFFHPSDCNALSILLQDFGDEAIGYGLNSFDFAAYNAKRRTFAREYFSLVSPS